MRVVLDARKYYDFGIGTYIQNLAATMESRAELVLIVSPQDALRIDLPATVRKKVNTSGKYSFRELFSIAEDANSLGADVFHAPHYTTPFGLHMPCVTTIHDILHIRGKDYYSPLQRLYARAVIAHACKVSSAIIVNSEFTKQELLKTFRFTEKSVHVVHFGVSPIFFTSFEQSELESFRIRHGIHKPTILYTGSLKPHKNVHVLLTAFSRLKSNKDYQLAIAGERITQHSDLWNLVQRLGITEQVIEIGEVSRKELALAYRAASVLVLPSFYEGFGFPVLEAMASGTPAIGANAGSIPEIMGDGGILFDPHSAEELAALLEKILEDEALQNRLKQQGAAQVARFSWERCTAETFRIYEMVL